MLHTKDFAASKLWGYYNLLDPYDVVKTERELLELLQEDGPYDGVIGYSQGASLACQALARYAQEHPGSAAEEMPFRFAVLFNPATPSKVWEVNEKLFPTVVDWEDPEVSNFMTLMKKNPLFGQTKFKPAELASGRKVLTDDHLAMAKFEPVWDGVPIKIPTLHVKCAGDRPEFGPETFHLCDKDVAHEFFHSHKHDFPRGHEEMKQIARAIRSLAESV